MLFHTCHFSFCVFSILENFAVGLQFPCVSPLYRAAKKFQDAIIVILQHICKICKSILQFPALLAGKLWCNRSSQRCMPGARSMSPTEGRQDALIPNWRRSAPAFPWGIGVPCRSGEHRTAFKGPAAEAAPYRPEGRRERCRVSTEKGNAAALSKVPGRLASQRFSAYNIGNFLYIPCLGM